MNKCAAAVLLTALLIVFSPGLRAGVIVNTSLSTSSLSITTDDATGTVDTSQLSPAVFGDVYDTLGDYNFGLDGPPDDPASATATIPLGYINDTASVAGGLDVSAKSGVHIFGVAAQAGTDTGNNANITGTFEVVDTTNPGQNAVNATFTADLSTSQSLLTTTVGDFVGVSAFSEVTFALSLPDLGSTGTPFLFYDNSVTIGPNSSSDTTGTPTLSQTASLLTNTVYDLDIEADAESAGVNATPEPASLILMAAGLAGIAARRLRRG